MKCEVFSTASNRGQMAGMLSLFATQINSIPNETEFLVTDYPTCRASSPQPICVPANHKSPSYNKPNMLPLWPYSHTQTLNMCIVWVSVHALTPCKCVPAKSFSRPSECVFGNTCGHKVWLFRTRIHVHTTLLDMSRCIHTTKWTKRMYKMTSHSAFHIHRNKVCWSPIFSVVGNATIVKAASVVRSLLFVQSIRSVQQLQCASCTSVQPYWKQKYIYLDSNCTWEHKD